MKRSITSKFLRHIRIRGGEFDASARAMHREAAIGNVPSATIERTNMSTKTTLKRVSLVAVAAMGFGLLSVVPSSAAVEADTLVLGSATGTMTVGGTAASTSVTATFTGLGGDTMTVTASMVSVPALDVGTTATLSNGTGVTLNGGTTVVAPTRLVGGVGYVGDTLSVTTSARIAGGLTVTLGSNAVAGTYIVKLTPSTVVGTPTLGVATAQLWTVTVGAAAAATADTTSTAYMAAGVKVTPVAADDLLPVFAPMAAGVQAATILVTPKLAGAASSVALTASITSGPGTLGLGASSTQASTGRYITDTAAISHYVTVWSDGTSGVSTITISAGAWSVTKTVNFYGAVASIVATVVAPIVPVGSAGVNVGAITAVAKDANGVVVPTGNLYATSSDLTKVSNSYAQQASISAAGVYSFNLVSVAAGTANITIGTGSSATVTVPAAINATAVAVRVGSTTAATVAVTFGKTSYLPGESAVVTVTLLDANGFAVLPGTYAAFTSTGLVSTIGLDAAGTLALANAGAIGVVVPAASTTGAATYAVVMPASSTDVTLNWTGGTALPTAAQVAGSATVSVAGDTTAIDAANAATDAANYAADAADAATTAAEEATAAATAAQDSADAATAAVVALGLRVERLYSATRSQVLSLQKLVVRLIKKLHA